MVLVRGAMWRKKLRSHGGALTSPLEAQARAGEGALPGRSGAGGRPNADVHSLCRCGATGTLRRSCGSSEPLAYDARLIDSE